MEGERGDVGGVTFEGRDLSKGKGGGRKEDEMVSLELEMCRRWRAKGKVWTYRVVVGCGLNIIESANREREDVSEGEEAAVSFLVRESSSCRRLPFAVRLSIPRTRRCYMLVSSRCALKVQPNQGEV